MLKYMAAKVRLGKVPHKQSYMQYSNKRFFIVI